METKRSKSRQDKLAQARKLLAEVRWQLTMMTSINHTGFMFDNETLRVMLRNNKHIAARWDQLQERKFRLERACFKLA